MLTTAKYSYWDDSSNHAYYPTYQGAASNSFNASGSLLTTADQGISPSGSNSSKGSVENHRDEFRELIDKIIENEKFNHFENASRELIASRDPLNVPRDHMNLTRDHMNAISRELSAVTRDSSMPSRDLNNNIGSLHNQQRESTSYMSSHSSASARSSSSSSDYHKELIKNSSFLAKFYNPDGTPLKSLWDSDSVVKEVRSYKYEPKPLERRKNPRSFVPDEKKTAEYWERRKKNNMAARKSREERRRNEIEVLECVENLAKDNIRMKMYAQKLMEDNQNLQIEIEMLRRLP